MMIMKIFCFLLAAVHNCLRCISPPEEYPLIVFRLDGSLHIRLLIMRPMKMMFSHLVCRQQLVPSWASHTVPHLVCVNSLDGVFDEIQNLLFEQSTRLSPRRRIVAIIIPWRIRSTSRSLPLLAHPSTHPYLPHPVSQPVRWDAYVSLYRLPEKEV